MIYRDLLQNARQCEADPILQLGIEGEWRRAGGEQGTDGTQRREPFDPVLRSLRESDNPGYRSGDVAVAGCFAAPGRSENGRYAVVHPNDGAVVIEQSCSGDVLSPEPRVRAFAGPRFPEEEHGFPSVFDGRGVNGDCLPRDGDSEHEPETVSQHNFVDGAFFGRQIGVYVNRVERFVKADWPTSATEIHPQQMPLPGAGEETIRLRILEREPVELLKRDSFYAIFRSLDVG